jgi:hypothetical protein
MVGRLGLTILLAAAVGVALLGPAPGVAAAAALGQADDDDEAGAGQRLDLPAIVVGPADLPDEGYGVSYSESWSLDGYATYLAGAFGQSSARADNLAEDLEAADWRQAYWIWLSQPSEDDPDVFGRNIVVELVEYAGDGAETGYDLLVDGMVEGGYDEAGGETVGDQSTYFRTSGTASTGEAYRWLGLVIQSGPLVARVVIVDFTNDSPPASEAERIGADVVERAEANQEDGEAGLGNVALRLAGDGVTYSNDWYRRLGGETRPWFGESEANREADDDWYEENGQEDVYWLNQSIPAQDEDDPPYGYVVDLVWFEDEDAAETFADEQPSRFAENPPTDYADVEEVEDAEELGDQSTLVSANVTRADGSEGTAYQYFVRVGEVMAILQLNGVPDVPQAVVEELAAAQTECLEAADCDLATVPADLGGESNGDGEGEAIEEVEIDLDEVDDSGVRGAAVLVADDDETETTIELRGSEEGMVAVVLEGTCDDLDDDPLADRAEVDDDGAATLVIPLALAELLDDEHALAVYATEDDFEDGEGPLACGEIAA